MNGIKGSTGFLCLFLALAATGCLTQPGGGEPTASVALSKIERDDFRPVAVDVLFEVDNSGSMAAEQDMIGRDFAAFVSNLLNPPPAGDGTPAQPVRDFHVGVVSTDLGVGGYNVQTCEEDPFVGDDGILQHTPSGTLCDASYPSFLSYAVDDDAPPDLAAIEKLSADFACISRLGTDGCGFEQQLEASYRALVDQTGPEGANAGFLRPEGIVALVYLTDEYDCSPADESIFDLSSLPFSICLVCIYQYELLLPVSRYVNMFDLIKPSRDQVALAVIAGVPLGDPACNGRGDQITTCLDQELMQHTIRPDGEALIYACKSPVDCLAPDPPYSGDCTSMAYPARRMVEMAVALGSSATVSSICADTYEPVLLDLAAMIREKQNILGRNPPPTFSKTDCTCTIDCILTETLPEGNTTCDAGKNLRVDGSGQTHCDIPQVGGMLSECTLACDDPAATFQPPAVGQGWYFNPNAPDGPAIEFIGLVPAEGAGLTIQCR